MTNEERNQLVEDNIKLSYHFARVHKSIIPNVEYDDAFGIAQLALVKAADAFDPSKGMFVTYANASVRNAFIKESKRVRTARQVPLEKVISLQSRINGTSELTLEDALCADDMTSNVIDKIVLRDALAVLPESDKGMLMLYYYMNYTTRDIAKVYGISYQLVAKRITAALLRIRRKLGGINSDFARVSGADCRNGRAD